MKAFIYLSLSAFQYRPYLFLSIRNNTKECMILSISYVNVLKLTLALE
ncbi:hypothetical protein DICVIV_01548 [Dictyocaulus viviparus]|uniref:Uncharacterized protein n=1 Tax=Dictyocaulus viviparus TaxID=29172 RepID=A0A0D8Y678_DICVI|nr:hypothetical protein DICVIV_01548 [Dictyocaulus viviparus]